MVSVPRASPLLRVALDRARLHLTESTSLPGGDVTDFPVTGQMRQQSGASPVLLLCCHTLSFFVPMRAPVRRSPCIPPPQSHWQHPPPHKGSAQRPQPITTLSHKGSSPTAAPQRLGGGGGEGTSPWFWSPGLFSSTPGRSRVPHLRERPVRKNTPAGGCGEPLPQQNATQEHPGSPGSCDSDSVTCTFAWLGPQNVSHMLAEAWCLLGLPFH